MESRGTVPVLTRRSTFHAVAEAAWAEVMRSIRLDATHPTSASQSPILAQSCLLAATPAIKSRTRTALSTFQLSSQGRELFSELGLSEWLCEPREVRRDARLFGVARYN